MTGRRTHRAFTLVEMLIAVGVIVLLTALTVSATVVLVQRAEVRQTEDTLQLLELALGEWEAQADRKISWGKVGVPFPNARYDLADGTPHVFTTTELLRTIRRSSAVQPIVARIKPELLYTYEAGNPPPWITLGTPGDPDPNAGSAGAAHDGFDGELAVLDAWGTPIRVVHPGRVADTLAFGAGPDSNPDEDGTIFVNDTDFYGTEAIYGRAKSRRIRFVSAGPDLKFGDLRAEEGTAAHEALHDNVVSYPVEDEHE